MSSRTIRHALAALACLSVGLAQAGIPIERWRHASGAQVYLVNSPGIPMVDVQIDVDGGSRREPASQAGLASAAAGLLSGGVNAWGDQPARDENALAAAWVDLGAQFGASASADRFTVQLRSLTEPDLLPRAVALAAQQLAAPSWPERVWQRDRERAVAALREAQNRPGTVAGQAFSQAVYGNHPYGRYSTPESLQAIEVADMRAFYRRHLSACRARITLVGAVDRHQAEAIVVPLVKAMSANGCPALGPVPEVAALREARELRLPFAAAQAQILMGQPGITRRDPDFLRLLVGNHILGGGSFTSRLTQEVREKRGLTYGVYSTFMPGRHAGAFQIGLNTRPDQADEALRVVRETLIRCLDEGPSEAELQAAKDNLINGFALRIDSNRKLLDNVANIAWNDLPIDYLDTWSEQVRRMTREEVHAALRRVLQPQRLVTVVVGAKP
ncbi:MAG: insulinase family protein [Hydrogenophaga sp.]|uniref:M16 family metallopeptidase n=1 Tax=Hydrogenophaga sp. TaxID=1904254 RepID=UPI001DA95823|nr:pitrilysin family protein [Hydrogenophaga sp.]MBX3610778.1 insulinase family protein [Hydrogenophaga sp.]